MSATGPFSRCAPVERRNIDSVAPTQNGERRYLLESRNETGGLADRDQGYLA
jgi:hypothetical protein